jgi:integrase
MFPTQLTREPNAHLSRLHYALEKPHGHAEELLGLQWEDADFDRRTIRHTVSDSIVAQHSRHRCVVLRLAYFLPLVRNGKRSSVFGIIG